MCGYQFSTEGLANITDSRTWRIDTAMIWTRGEGGGAEGRGGQTRASAVALYERLGMRVVEHVESN